MAVQINGTSGVSGVDGSASTPALQGSDSNTGIVFGTDTVQVATGGSTRATVDSSGRFLVGTTGSDQDAPLTVARTGTGGSSPSTISSNTVATFRATGGLSHEAHVSILGGSTGASRLNFGDRDDEDVASINYDHSNNFMQFNTSAAEAMRIDSNGRVGIGVTPSNFGTNVTALEVHSPSAANSYIALTNSTTGSNGASNGFNLIATGNDASLLLRESGYLSFQTSDAERARFTSDGSLLVGKTSTDFAVAGSRLYPSGEINFTRDNGVPLFIRRNTSDGILVSFYQDGNQEGTISVSGSTVSYNGGHLTRWSQLAGGAERTEILRGSVLSNLDEMCEWAYDAQDAVLYTEEDELPEGVSVGDVKTPAVAAGTENNEQLNRMKVSDVEGDPNVSGVFQGWDDDDDTYTNDFYCAMTGDFVIRIAQGTTVARGDLLMSAGDGTAKPQNDDIVRSKTIAKVTSTTVSVTYADGSYCVPCVLMAC